jgi:hypothetical protein
LSSSILVRRAALAITLLVAAGCKPGEADHKEATAIRSFVYDQFILGQKQEPKVRPTMYFGPGRSATHLTVYGVLRAEDQNRIVDLVREARKVNSSKPVVVRFMEAEVWSESGNTKSRSGEKLLKAVKVDD